VPQQYLFYLPNQKYDNINGLLKGGNIVFAHFKDSSFSRTEFKNMRFRVGSGCSGGKSNSVFWLDSFKPPVL